MDIHIDVSTDEDARFGLYAAAGYELTVGGLSINMRAEQFQQLCDNLRPWVVDATPPAGAGEAVAWRLVGIEDRPKARTPGEPGFIVTAMGRDGVRAGHFAPHEWETLSMWEATIRAVTTDGKPPVAAPTPLPEAVRELVGAAQRVLDKEWEYGDEQPHCVRLDAAIGAVGGGA